jgi:hypothetical protein
MKRSQRWGDIADDEISSSSYKFKQILQAFRQMAGPQWENQMLSFGPTIAERLRARYNV